jgi:hypothetical protein
MFVQAGFGRSHPVVRPITDWNRGSQRVSHRQDRYRVNALPLLDLPAIGSASLFEAFLNPTELHQLVDTATKGTMQEGIDELGVSILTPRGIMGKSPALTGEYLAWWGIQAYGTDKALSPTVAHTPHMKS